MSQTTPREQYIATFNPLPWHIPVWHDKSRIVLATGSAGGGKSRICAEKVHGFCLKYPGATALVVRKTRESVTKSAALFLDQTVIGDDKNVEHVPSQSLFRYTNGSMIFYGGMKDEDQRESVRSIGGAGGVDFIWMEEANKFGEPDFNELLGRLRGTSASWRQIILSTNPDSETHWIKRRLIDGMEARVYYSSAADNPYNPPDYIQILESMTGIQRQRLYEGLWVQAEGVIYDNWSHENVGLEADYDSALGSVFWAMDDGYVFGGGPGTASFHPRAALLFQMTPQGGMHVFGEYYKALQMPEATIEELLGAGYPAPEMAYVDSSAAELRARLSAAGIYNAGATHVVSEGIKAVRRFICDGNGVRQLLVHPRCANLIREVQTYRYADSMAGVSAGEPKPLKQDDHACLIAGTMIDTARGAIVIEDVRTGDLVLTREGYFPVVDAGMTDPSAVVYEVAFSDGRTLCGTANHPIYVDGKGYTTVDALRYGDIIRTNVRHVGDTPWQRLTRPFAKKKLSSTASFSAATQMLNGWLIGATSSRTLGTFGAAFRRYTAKYGKRTTVQSLMGGMFTTSTKTPEITGSKIWSAYRGAITYPFTCAILSALHRLGLVWKSPALALSSGTRAQQAGSGTDSTRGMYGNKYSPYAIPANNAALNLKRWRSMGTSDSAPTSARRHGGGLLVWITLIASAFSAGLLSRLTATANSVHAARVARASTDGVYVENVTRLSKRARVFNLQIDAVPEYYANGVLVHNCDALRYACHAFRTVGD